MEIPAQSARERTLQLFLERAAELEAYRFYSKRNDWCVHFDAPEQSSFPDEEDFKAFLTCFRQFFLKKEPVHLDLVWAAALGLTESSEEKSVLAQSRDQCSRNRQGSLLFHMDGQTYGPERVFDTYIYGGIFHSDAEKMKVLSSVKQPPAGHVWKFTVFFFVDMAVREIAYLKAVIGFMLRRREDARCAELSTSVAETSVQS
jgi:hypothetical protein